MRAFSKHSLNKLGKTSLRLFSTSSITFFQSSALIFLALFPHYLKNEEMILGKNVNKSFKRGFNPFKISANGLVARFLDKNKLKVLSLIQLHALNSQTIC